MRNNHQMHDYSAKIESCKRERKAYLDPIRGCIFGGAVGDALGYPVEFLQDKTIFERYGENGITEYELDRVTGKALISDDTQMTLFTANGLLVGDTRGRMRGICAPPRVYVEKAYRDWLYTQSISFEDSASQMYTPCSWLCDVPELYARRAPGTTCLSALSEGSRFASDDFTANPKNSSKGCGGVMRIAPLALNDSRLPIRELDMEAAQIAAITHGHSLGYMPASVLCHILNRIVFPIERKMSLKGIIIEAKHTIEKIFEGDKHLKTLCDIIDLAVTLSENEEDDLKNIRNLGEGWVAEETLAIAIYCSLRHTNDFSRGVIAAVNHSGDSDSTGAVTGNILGAIVGYNSISNRWKKKLECADIILEMADDLCYGCPMSEYDPYPDPVWTQKYIKMHWSR